MSFTRHITAGLTVVCLGATGVMAALTGPQKEAAAARYAHMNLQAFNLGILAKMVQGRVPYDADSAKAAAGTLRALASEDWRNYFLPGTSSDDADTSRASPKIWATPEDFAARKQAFIDAAVAMETAAGTDKDAMKAALPALTEACGACHRDYRTIP